MRKKSTTYYRKDIIEMGKTVSQNLNIPLNVVLMAYYLFYDKIANDISSMNLRDNEVQDNLDDLTLSFNIKHLGKFYTTKEVINKINSRRKDNENIKHKNGDTY